MYVFFIGCILGLPRWHSGKESAMPVQETQEIQVPALGLENPLEKGMAYPLQYSRLENPMDKGAWRATVHGLQRVGHNWCNLAGTHTEMLKHTSVQAPAQNY